MEKSSGGLSDADFRRVLAVLKEGQSKMVGSAIQQVMPNNAQLSGVQRRRYPKEFHLHREISVVKSLLGEQTVNTKVSRGVNLPILGHGSILPAYALTEANCYRVTTELGPLLSQKFTGRMSTAFHTDAASSSELRRDTSELGAAVDNHANMLTDVILSNLRRGRTLLYTLYPLEVMSNGPAGLTPDRVMLESKIMSSVAGVSYDYGAASASAFEEMALSVPCVTDVKSGITASPLSTNRLKHDLDGPALFTSKMLTKADVEDMEVSVGRFLSAKSFQGVIHSLLRSYLGGCLWSILSGERRDEVIPLSLCPSSLVMVDVDVTRCAFLVGGLVSLSVHAQDQLSPPLLTTQVSYAEQGLQTDMLLRILSNSRKVKDVWGNSGSVYAYEGLIGAIMDQQMSTTGKSSPACYYRPTPAILD